MLENMKNQDLNAAGKKKAGAGNILAHTLFPIDNMEDEDELRRLDLQIDEVMDGNDGGDNSMF